MVLSHQMEDGQERPVAYASQTLTPAEKKYAQLEREGLAIIFGVKKFHNYLYGREFIIESDHQPLAESRVVPPMASSRIQRCMGTDIGSVQVHYPLQGWKISGKCRCIE